MKLKVSVNLKIASTSAATTASSCAKLSTCCGGPAKEKTCKKNPQKRCSELVWLDIRKVPGSPERTKLQPLGIATEALKK